MSVRGPSVSPVSALLQPVPLLHKTDFVVVDLETTGWLTDAASITEIGAVRFGAGQPTTEFSALVNPGAPIPPDITALTGITDAMVSQAPPIEQVLPRFLDFAAGSVIAAHNAPFDVGFLTAACQRSGMAWPAFAVIDTAMLARLVLGPADVPDHKLATLSGHFGTQTGPCHRALADAKATADVLCHLLGLLASAGAAHPELAGAKPAGAEPAGARPATEASPAPWPHAEADGLATITAAAEVRAPALAPATVRAAALRLIAEVRQLCRR
jgi:DNA polymerase III subunit epsilon